MSGPASSQATDAPGRASPSRRKREALELFRGLPRHYDLLSAVLSFGQDPRWRRALVSGLAPAPGERVLDVATGTGLVAAELLGRGCSVVALDQSEEMLAAARRRFGEPAAVAAQTESERAALRRDAPRLQLLRGEAEALPFPSESFSALSFTYLLRYVDDPAATMRELARVLRPGGRIASLEFGVPPRALARAAWRAYTGVGLPLLARAVSREWGEVGRFLGPSIRDFYQRHPLERIVCYWQQAGLENVRVVRMSLGGGVLMFAVRARHGARTADAGRNGRAGA